MEAGLRNSLDTDLLLAFGARGRLAQPLEHGLQFMAARAARDGQDVVHAHVRYDHEAGVLARGDVVAGVHHGVGTS